MLEEWGKLDNEKIRIMNLNFDERLGLVFEKEGYEINSVYFYIIYVYYLIILFFNRKFCVFFQFCNFLILQKSEKNTRQENQN